MSEKSFIFHSDLGNVIATVVERETYDVEDIISARAYSQAMAIKLARLGKSVDPNQLTGARSIASIYANNDEELED